MKKVAVIGSGAREHALVRTLLRGASLPGAEPREVVAIPGNPGIALEARCVAARGSSAPALAEAAIAEKPGLVVVGPEAPLAEGLADLLREAGIACFGPSAAAAQLEASKSFAKEVMRAAGVPMARGAAFDSLEAAREAARGAGACVVKLDGLAAGKGVIVCADASEAAAAVDELYALGRAQSGSARSGPRILIEERLSGPEISVIALTDGERVLLLPPARDHKRLLEGDRGPNTGGMGAVSPPALATPALLEELRAAVLEPTVREMSRRGTPFRGALFAGLMLTPQGPRVLEFNCRLGDPEAQAILLRVRSDLLPLFDACARGSIDGMELEIDPRPAVALVLAAQGYPVSPRQGDRIEGLAPQNRVAETLLHQKINNLNTNELGLNDLHPNDLAVFHAGTRGEGGAIVTAGGRVLSLCALGADVAQARARALALSEIVTFEGRQLRRDIAAQDE